MIIICLLGAVSILLLMICDPMNTPKTEKKEMKLLKRINYDFEKFSSIKICALMKSDKLLAVSMAQPRFISPIPIQKAKWIR